MYISLLWFIWCINIVNETHVAGWINFFKSTITIYVDLVFRRNTRERGKKVVIPYGALLQKVMNLQGRNELLEAYKGEDKMVLSNKCYQIPIGRTNIQRMKLPSVQEFLDKKAKEKEVDEAKEAMKA